MSNFTDPYEKQHSPLTKLNPFISVWLHPKQTARYMIDAKSIGYAIFVLSIGYIGSLLSGLAGLNLPAWGIILLSIVLAPIIGVIGLSISAAISWIVGKWFKGVGTFSELFKALSLTGIPFIIMIPIYIIWLFVSPESLRVTDDVAPLSAGFWVANIITAVISIWSLIITIAAVAEAHRFSNWRAFFTIIIPSIVFGIIIFAIVAVVIVGIIGMATV